MAENRRESLKSVLGDLRDSLVAFESEWDIEVSSIRFERAFRFGSTRSEIVCIYGEMSDEAVSCQ